MFMWIMWQVRWIIGQDVTVSLATVNFDSFVSLFNILAYVQTFWAYVSFGKQEFRLNWLSVWALEEMIDAIFTSVQKT